jgi:hypothetical protein
MVTVIIHLFSVILSSALDSSAAAPVVVDAQVFTLCPLSASAGSGLPLGGALGDPKI